MTRSASLTLDTLIARCDDLVFSEVDGEITMMNVESGRYYGLTRVGSAIWGLLDAPRHGHEICGRLMHEYRVDRDRCEGEVLSFLRRLYDEGLVVAPSS